jgi:DNA-binding NarL/FixJ family response regulator
MGQITQSLPVPPLGGDLPGIDGIQACREVRGRWPQVKIFILTVSEDSQKTVRSVCADKSGYHLEPAVAPELAEAIHEVLDGMAPAHATESSVDILTERERRALQLMADGLTKKQIAARLQISPHTVSTHVRSIYQKLDVTTNTGAVAKALRERLI